MRNRFAMAGAVWLWTATLGVAQTVLPGTYDVAGTDSDGTTPYGDVARLTLGDEGQCQLDYGEGQGVMDDILKGICLIDGDRIAASSIDGGHWLGLFRLTGAGQIEGRWRIEGERGEGREILTLRK